MPLDLTLDYLVLDGREAVTLDGGAVANAYRLQDHTIEGDSSEGAYLHREMEFQLPTEPAIAPVVGSVLIAGAVTYIVQRVRQPFAGDYWGLTVRQASITADATLNDSITLWPVTVATDEFGSRIASFPAADGVFAAIAAKIQPRPAVEDVIAGKHQWRRMFDIYVATEVTSLSIGDLLEDGDMNRYEVKTWRNRERIDELSVIECEYKD